MLDRYDMVSDFYIRIKFLAYLPHQSLPWSFARFDLSARGLPPVLVRAITPFSCEDPAALNDDRRHDID